MVGRFVDWIFVLVALIGLAATGWWAVYAGPSNAEVLENTLQNQVNTTLKDSGHSWAEVVMDGQVARVKGASPSFEAQEAALLSIGEADVLRGGITKISSEFVSSPPISPYTWSAELSPDGAVKLTGFVPSSEIKDQFSEKAAEIAPDSVINDLKIAAGVPPGSWQETATLGLSNLQSLEHGTAKMSDYNLVISGQAPNNNIVADVRNAIAEVAAPFTATSLVSGGYEWHATHDGDILILEGPVAADADRLEILSVAEDSFDGIVRDNMIVLPTSLSPWQSTVIAALPQFAKFEKGKLSARSAPEQVRIRGATYGSVEAFLKQDLVNSAVPVDYQLDILAVEITELGSIDLSASTPDTCQQGFDAVMSANTVLFQTGSAVIDRVSGVTLDKIMQVVSKCSALSFEIHGHTDSAGNRENNIILSTARAEAVKNYMINRGVNAEKIEIVGFGPDTPIADNQTSTGRAKNRRIEFKIAGEG